MATVAAIGWIAEHPETSIGWARNASLIALAISTMAGIATLALIPLVAQRITVRTKSIYEVKPWFRVFPWRCHRGRWWWCNRRISRRLKSACWPQHIFFLVGIVLYVIAHCDAHEPESRMERFWAKAQPGWARRVPIRSATAWSAPSAASHWQFRSGARTPTADDRQKIIHVHLSIASAGHNVAEATNRGTYARTPVTDHDQQIVHVYCPVAGEIRRTRKRFGPRTTTCR